MSRPPLRVGLLLDSFVVPRWIHSVIEEIQQSDFARVAFVVTNDAPPVPKRGVIGWLKNRHELPFTIFAKLDERLFRRRVALDAFASVDAKPLLEGVPVRAVRPIQKKFSDWFPEDDVAAVREQQLDVIIRFGFRILRGEILETARYGVWSYHHDDNRLYRGGPALFWEMCEGNCESGTILQILSEQLDGGRVIYRSTSATDFTSWFRNRNANYWKTARFAARRLRDLHRGGDEAFARFDEHESREPYTRGIYRIPRWPKVLRVSLGILVRLVRNRWITRMYQEQWFVAVAPRPEHVTDADARPRFTLLSAPRGRFWADPFVVERDGETFLFFEDYDYARGKGVISCVTLSGGKPSQPRVVLERPYHLSYPAIFQHGGEIWMTPETAENRTIELYRATSFPFEWQLERVLVDGVVAVDPTLHAHDGKLWLFANVATTGAVTEDELHVWFADGIEGPWQPHPKNPVVSDVRSSRPAGALFVENGVLHRPAQNCAAAYGEKMTINRIDVLTTTEYRETPVRTIEPRWLPKSLCTHTLNMSGRWLVTDGKRRVPRWRLA